MSNLNKGIDYLESAANSPSKGVEFALIGIGWILASIAESLGNLAELDVNVVNPEEFPSYSGPLE